MSTKTPSFYLMHRGEQTNWLRENHTFAFLLLTVIAERVRWNENNKSMGLQLMQCVIGTTEKLWVGCTRMQIRVSPTHSYSVAGVYSVTLTSMVEEWTGNCSNSITKVISVGLSAGAPSVTNVTCNGSQNGSFTVAPTGGATPYSYSVDGVTYGASSVFSGLVAGVYTPHVKDALGCDQSTVVMITQPTAISFASPTTTNATCANQNGGIQVSATGGSGTLQYSINGSTWQGTGNFSALGAGTYTVWAKDANGCTNHIKTTVDNVGGPTLSIVSSTNVNCFGNNNASIVASATGGTSPLQYSINGTTFQNSGTFNGLAADTFYVTVKDGAGCLNILPVIVSQPAKLNFIPSSTPAICNGGSTGYILVNNVMGGTGTMVYAVDGSNYQSGNSFSGIAAGVHTAYVKDAAGCVATHTVTVTQPSVITTTLLATNPTCNNSSNGDILVIAGGGTPGYSYSMNGEDYFPEGDFGDLYSGAYTITIKDANGCWTKVYPVLTQPSTITSTVTIGNSTCGNLNGNILVAAAGGSGSGYQYSINGTTFNGSGSFTGLKDSTYNVLVQDGSGCSKVFTAVVANSNGPVINTVSSTNITCNEGSNGSITITNVTGGSGTLNYQLNGSGWQTSTSFTGLSAGLNTIVVKDGLGCSGSYQITLTQPAAISVNVATADLLCSGIAAGSATITAGGGSGTMAYSMNGNFYQSSNMFTSLAAGTYQAFVRDAGGCISTNTFTIASPAAIVIANTGVLDVTCHGAGNGAVNVVASGGTGNLQYSLDGLTYQNSNSFSGLNGGNYTVFVKDNNGCVKTQAIVINEPAAISVSTSISNVSCAGGANGSIAASVTGGTGSYTYMWSGHHGSTSIISNINAGTYILTVLDQHDCSATTTVTVSQPASPLIINATVTDASGSTTADGSIHSTVTGGTPFYTYSWSNNATTPNITGLTPGTYVVNVTDMNGCITSGVYNVGFSTGIQNITSGSTQIKLYPNPTDAFITLESNNAVIDHVEVLNLLGDVLYTDSPKTVKVDINLTGLVEGMYFVRYTANGAMVTKRVELLKH